MRNTPLNQFCEWLPGEMEYSARKANHVQKMKRATLPLDDPQSMYSFLASEWFQHRAMLNRGVHYMPFHGMSAQLQAAKFAAGLYEKSVLSDWAGEDTTHSEAYARASRATGELITQMPFTFLPNIPEDEMGYFREFGNHISDTPFDEGLRELVRMLGEISASNAESKDLRVLKDACSEHAWGLGGLATRYYIHYAAEYLTPEQYELPVSAHEQ